MAGSVTGETRLFTYTFFHVGARAALTSAEESEEGQSYNLLNSLILSSFLVEAYFNHLGDLLGYPEWNDKKNRTTVWNKYRRLREKVGLPDSSIDGAYPDVAEAIKFRNEMAHGRTETHKFSLELPASIGGENSRQIPVGWQIALTTPNARKCFDACRGLIYELHSKANLGNHPFTKMASSQIRFGV
ncbi:hypothetical protein H8L49_27855 [Klebsiella quasipneumoniae]|uniref:hypothetical protein n=1 Tax=Klebsiella quasipneumoniae TaxID=1463165 RepID=UPI00164AA7D1|nr:hypothetical protein [Klebsiella quasipneumoniae]MBC4813619.1 hypothetical protein [Klebsiella quasipneumoniae]